MSKSIILVLLFIVTYIRYHWHLQDGFNDDKGTTVVAQYTLKPKARRDFMQVV